MIISLNFSLAREYPALWEQVCRSMGLVADQVIASQRDVLIKQFTTDFVPSPIDQQVQWQGTTGYPYHIVIVCCDYSFTL